MKALGTLHPFAIDFVKKSLCESTTKDVLVCCGSLGNFVGFDWINTTEATPVVNSTEIGATISTSIQEQGTTPNITQASLAQTERTTTESRTETGTTEIILADSTETSVEIEDTTPNITQRISALAESTAIDNRTIKMHRDFVKQKFLPSRRYCGYQHTDDRVYTDSVIALDEYPWLVHLIFIEDEEEDTEQYLDRCNGVLLNKRYVLTTKFCGYLALRARFGQYYTNETIACNEDPNLPECTDPILEIEIESEIHRFNEEERWHDFTLLRLAKNVPYSDYVRPICLPFEEYNLPKEPSRLYFTGWGGKENSGMYKKRLVYKPTTVDACFKLDDKGLRDQVSFVMPVCMVPEQSGGEVACTGDEAGPLLFSNRHQWFVDSIITRVYSKITDQHYCSNELPIAGIKITQDILDWIVDNIKD